MSRFLPSAEWVLATRAALEADLHYDWEQSLAQEKCDEAGPDDLDAVVAELQALPHEVPIRSWSADEPFWFVVTPFTESGTTSYRGFAIRTESGEITHAGAYEPRNGARLSDADRAANPSLAASFAAGLSGSLVMDTHTRMRRDHPAYETAVRAKAGNR